MDRSHEAGAPARTCGGCGESGGARTRSYFTERAAVELFLQGHETRVETENVPGIA
jgi:hypothetical protein